MQAGNASSFLGIAIYILLNWSYTTAVFTSPGTTTGRNGYSSLPTHASPAASNFTVKSNGGLRFCKKCQARKPDRAHHCSTCRTCVLKMDHHCPWLATCVGLHNYKAFLLFLIYTTLFCFLCFAVSAMWVWREILNEGQTQDSLMPVNYVMLTVVSGIIGIVLAGFTGWHILLASRNQTTIECLEKTRYLSPLRKSMQHQHIPEDPDNQQPLELMANGEQRHPTYDAMQRARARQRYEEYLDEQDSEKLPSAFNLGWRRNFVHLFGPKKYLWAFPICNSTGDGWNWEPSLKWVAAREKLAREREEQRTREHRAGWGEPLSPEFPPQTEGAGRHYVSYPKSSTPSRGERLSKADRILGRTAKDYADEEVSMQTLHPRGDDGYELSSDEEEAERRGVGTRMGGIDGRRLVESGIEGLVGGIERATEQVAKTNWPAQVQRVGIATNTLLGNTRARQKDDVKGWDGLDDGGVD